MTFRAVSRQPMGEGHHPTLLILAAGVGSRFGGLKQLEPVGPGGQAILDYTIAHGLEAGFGRVVIVVRTETEKSIRDHLRKIHRAGGQGSRGRVMDAVDLVVQPGDPDGPGWGTGYAVLAAAEVVGGPFAVANADDFYGKASLAGLATHLADPSRAGEWALVAFDLAHTLSPHGGVSRAICESGPEGFLVSVREANGIARDDDGVIRDDAGTALPPDTPVSMNLWGFGPEIFAVLSELAQQREAERYASREGRSGGPGEFRLPDAVGEAIRRGVRPVRMLRTDERWVGLTHPGDLEETRRVLRQLRGQRAHGP